MHEVTKHDDSHSQGFLPQLPAVDEYHAICSTPESSRLASC